LDHYLELHPDGWFQTEIKNKIENLAFAKVKADSSEGAIQDYLNYSILNTYMEDVLAIQFLMRDEGHLVRAFSAKYPNSKYADKAKKKIAQLWEVQVAYFDSVAKPFQSGSHRQLISFYRELLLYMKANDKYEFVTIFKSKKEFKKYADYPKLTKNMLRIIYENIPVNERIPGFDLPDESNVFEIQSNFPLLYLFEKERAAGEKLKASVFSLFSPKFFSFRMIISDEENKNYSDKEIPFEFNYVIKNEEDEFSIPGLRVYYDIPDTLNQKSNRFKGYAMAIEAQFNVVLNNPGTKQNFKISRTKKQPDIDGNFVRLNEGYEKILNLIFNQFCTDDMIIFKNAGSK
jgi:hypothetical protein